MKKYYVDVDVSNFTLNKRIRNNQLEGYNYILVVGEKEVENHTINVRKRDEQTPLGEMRLEQLYDHLSKEEVGHSNLIKTQQMRSSVYPENVLSKEDVEKLSDWNQELKYKNYFEGEGFEKGQRDDEVWQKLKEVHVDSHQLPNLFRWHSMMKKKI